MVVAALSSGLTAAMTQRTLKGSAGRTLGCTALEDLPCIAISQICSKEQLALFHGAFDVPYPRKLRDTAVGFQSSLECRWGSACLIAGARGGSGSFRAVQAQHNNGVHSSRPFTYIVAFTGLYRMLSRLRSLGSFADKSS